jgi:XTP/dITP diphosphohydrolase
MTTLLLATGNSHKTREVRALLGAGWEIEDLSAHPDWPEVAETGATFAENAGLKAVAASLRAPGTLVLADDSGLEVDALAGAPGVYSARYAGPGAGDAANRRKLLAELESRGVSRERPGARFRCHIAVARNGSWLAGFDGVVEGAIAPEERGDGGFGYDALFIPLGHDQTFGELPAEVKNRFSHRAAALAQVANWLRAQIPPGSGPVGTIAGDGTIASLDRRGTCGNHASLSDRPDTL